MHDRRARWSTFVIVRDDARDVDELGLGFYQPREGGLGLAEIVVLAEQIGAIEKHERVVHRPKW